MTRPLRLAINGKFLAAAPTGVHRVARELTESLAHIAARRPDQLDVELWIPRDAAQEAAAIDLPKRIIAPFTHIPWEQFSIPLRDRSRLLLNLCNIGPLARANAMTMIHDAQVYLTPQSYGRPFRLWYKGVQPLLGMRNRAILTVSHYSASQIAHAGVCRADQIEVVHNGVDHMLRVISDDGAIARLGLQPGRFAIALASTQAHKNIALLAHAFSMPAVGDIRLLLVGDASRQSFAAQGIFLPASTIFAGRVSDGELRALYEQAACLAFPSRTEGFGLPPLEAMLVGCPAIVAPCGALPEVCGDAALYADPDAPAEWAALVRRLGGDAAFHEEWAGRGRRQAARFTWASAAEGLLAITARRAGAGDRAAANLGIAPAEAR